MTMSVCLSGVSEVRKKFGDRRHAFGDLLGIDVAKHYLHIAGRGPLRDARAHDARANDGNALRGPLAGIGAGGEFLRAFLEKEKPDEIAAGFRF
jgi:hypothetical protein